MPFCPQCGVDNPAGARYCDQCGAMLIPALPSRRRKLLLLQPPFLLSVLLCARSVVTLQFPEKRSVTIVARR